MTGLTAAAKLQTQLGIEIPVIILPGDISIHALQAIADQKCRQMNKPVQLSELAQAIQALLPRTSLASAPSEPHPG